MSPSTPSTASLISGATLKAGAISHTIYLGWFLDLSWGRKPPLYSDVLPSFAWRYFFGSSVDRKSLPLTALWCDMHICSNWPQFCSALVYTESSLREQWRYMGVHLQVGRRMCLLLVCGYPVKELQVKSPGYETWANYVYMERKELHEVFYAQESRYDYIKIRIFYMFDG